MQMHPHNSYELASLQGLLQEIGLKSASYLLVIYNKESYMPASPSAGSMAAFNSRLYFTSTSLKLNEI